MRVGLLTTAALVAASVLSVAGQGVPYESVWEYYDQGNIDDEPWNTLNYDSRDWSSGDAPLGYGGSDLQLNTGVGFGPNSSRKFPTCYFRLVMQANLAPGQVNIVRMSLVADDGAVVYVNGVEVARFNMPDGEPTFFTLATDGVGDATYENAQSFEFTSELFQNGANVVAVRVHQQAQSSSDMRFDFQMSEFILPSTTPSATSTATSTSTMTATPSTTPLPNGPEQLKKTAPWRYNDLGQDLGTEWRELNYNDASWAVGRAPLGYGESFVTTLLDYGGDGRNRHITYYFRYEFRFDRVGAKTYAGFVDYQLDDGAVFYLNGIEVARINMDEGPVTFSTVANAAVAGGAEKTFFSFVAPDSAIRDGVNVMAVEVHQSAPSSSDVTFEMQMLIEEALPSASPAPSTTSTATASESASGSTTPAPVPSPTSSVSVSASESMPPSPSSSNSPAPSASSSPGAAPSATSSNSPAPSSSGSSTPAASPSRTPVPIDPSATPTQSPAVVGSPVPQDPSPDASATPAASTSAAPGSDPSTSPTSSPVANNNGGGDNSGCTCSCADLTCCGDQQAAMIAACSSISSGGGGSNTTVAWAVAASIVGLGAVGAFVFLKLYSNRQGAGGKGRRDDDDEDGGDGAGRKKQNGKYSSVRSDGPQLVIMDGAAPVVKSSGRSRGAGKATRPSTASAAPSDMSDVSDDDTVDGKASAGAAAGAGAGKKPFFSFGRGKKSSHQVGKSYDTADSQDTATTATTATTAPPAPPAPLPAGKHAKKTKSRSRSKKSAASGGGGGGPALPPVSDDVINAYLKARGANITVQQLEKLSKRAKSPAVTAKRRVPAVAESEEDVPQPPAPHAAAARRSPGVMRPPSQPQGVFPRYAGAAGGGSPAGYGWEAAGPEFPPEAYGHGGHMHAHGHGPGPGQGPYVAGVGGAPVTFDGYAPQNRYHPQQYPGPGMHTREDQELMAQWDAAVGDYTHRGSPGH